MKKPKTPGAFEEKKKREAKHECLQRRCKTMLNSKSYKHTF